MKYALGLRSRCCKNTSPPSSKPSSARSRIQSTGTHRYRSRGADPRAAGRTTMQGRCLCEGVVWEAGGRFSRMHHCHCSRCRKALGAAFGTFLSVPEPRFEWQRRDSRVRFASSPGVTRAFCGRCGSVVPDSPTDGRVTMPAGSFEGDPGVRPAAHIFADSKARWDDIAEGVLWVAGLP